MNLHFHIPHGLTDVIVATSTVPFVDNMRSVNVFVFQIEKTFNLSCLPKDDENVFETRELSFTFHKRNVAYPNYFCSAMLLL